MLLRMSNHQSLSMCSRRFSFPLALLADFSKPTRRNQKENPAMKIHIDNGHGIETQNLAALLFLERSINKAAEFLRNYSPKDNMMISFSVFEAV